MKTGWHNEQGIALLMALFLITLVTGIVIDIQDMIRGDVVGLIAYQDRLQARENAQSGIDAAKLLLLYDREEDWRTNRKVDYYFDPTGLADLLKVVEMWSFFAPGNADKLAKLGMKNATFPLDSGAFSLKIEDLQGRVPLNRYYRPAGLKPKDQDYKNLMNFLTTQGIEEGQASVIVDSLLDWLDPDDTPRPNGAESETYDFADQPYLPRNGPLMAPDELRAIRGVDDVVYALLKNNVTVWPGDLKLYASYKININTADAAVLTALDDQIGLEEADAIVAERDNGPFLKVMDLQRVMNKLGLRQAWNRIFGSAILTVRSDYFKIIASGLAGRTEVVLETVIKREDNGKFKTLFFTED